MGIIKWLFNRVLRKKIAKSPDFIKAVKDAELSKNSLVNYEKLADRENHDFDSAAFKNVYKPIL